MNATSSNDAAQARAALEQAQTATLTTGRDRRIHGVATAGFGIAMGLFVAAHRVADGHGNLGAILSGAYVLAVGLIALWQRRTSRTVPRNARILGYVGSAASAVLMLASIIWLNVRQGDNRTAGLPDQVDAWWVHAVAAVLTALPMLVAGLLIARGDRSGHTRR